MESAELIAILREVRDRVRARHPQTSAPGNVPLADLMPLVHARDAAMSKVASIGMVNPRRGGLVNASIQGWKRLVARMLDWHVREQVIFNRKVMECVDAAIEALNESNRAVVELADRLAAAEEQRREGDAEMIGKIASAWHETEAARNETLAALTETKAAQEYAEKLRQENEELKDIRKHWAEWRAGWEHKVAENEVQFLRAVADLQGAFQHRVTLMDASYRDSVRGQHTEFTAALTKGFNEIWASLERMRVEYERLIHTELRLIRQRTEPVVSQPSGTGSAPVAQSQPAPALDYGRFAERFRGSEEYVRTGQQIYLPYFAGRRNVLDIGCGRGEFLELMRSAGVPARGIDLGAESVALSKHKGLEADEADLFDYLAAQPEGCFDGIFCAQVIEHLPPEQLPQMVRLAASRLEPGGVIAIETPNPECLAIFASHFFIDPTHTRPVPYPLLVFYLEEAGVGGIEVKKLSPAVDSMPALASLPQEFREAFFGGLDYAAVGKKL